jgi:hypothetical protein
MKFLNKKFLATLLVLAAIAPQLVLADNLISPLHLLDQKTTYDIQNQADRAGSAFGRTTTGDTFTQYIAIIINVFLGLLGTIFIILIVYGGFTWMTGGGNPEKISKAQTILKVAVIGLIIIVSAYAITYFIFSRLPDTVQQ